MAQLFNLTDVWNAAGTAFRGIKLAVTDTVSAAASAIMELLGGSAGTTLLFKVDKNGLVSGSFQNAITAFAGGGQGSAVQLTRSINRVTTVATAADSVKLPAATAGLSITVINAAAANAMNVFPATGEAINALSANTALSVVANKTITFFCAVDGTWNSQLTA
jgi:hypothetical protein